ncbi:MAG: biosynthetic-type acetolactate synthase large subunit [Acidobacteriota bacterium]
MKLTGAEIVWECVLREGTDLVFGYPGGAVLPLYDALTKYPQMKHVLVRHEQGASHMADGYARATGKVGVAVATSGPGATNLVTGIATAMLDSSPTVFITGQVPTSVIGSDAFQEVDITGITLPITKHNYLITNAEELAPTIREAFYLARTGRPGPVLIDIPKDVQSEVTEFVYPENPVVMPNRPRENGCLKTAVNEMITMLGKSRRPVILAGQGILLSGSENELRTFAEKASIPVTATLLGKGVLPDSHELNLGMMGMHGEPQANLAIQKSDLLIALGMRFDDRVTGNLREYAPDAKKIHIDIDASEINKNVKVELGIVGDLKKVLAMAIESMPEADHLAWMELLQEWRSDSIKRDIHHMDPHGKLYAAHVIRDIWEHTKGDIILTTDVGQHQMWAAQYFDREKSRTLITSGGLGTMGFGFPAAIGAKMGCPDQQVWALVGDGGFQMTMTELGTAVEQKTNVTIAIINNGYLGMVRQWQEMFYGERYHMTPMHSPDFCKLAEAYGIPARKVTSPDEVKDAIDFAQNVQDGPVILEFVVEKEDMVYPMVSPGQALDKMVQRPFSTEEKGKE